MPLAVIEVPFTQIGMDLLEPLPKSAWGHKQILVIVDYATQYPEAIRLKRVTTAAIVQLLMDQGTPLHLPDNS